MDRDTGYQKFLREAGGPSGPRQPMRYCHSFGSPVRFEAPTTTDKPAAPSAAKSPVVSVVVRTSYDGLAWAETDSATGKKKTVVVDPQTGNKLVIDE